MGTIEVDSDVYEEAQRTLRDAAERLRSAGGRLVFAVPPLAFGPIAMPVPVAFGQLGTAVEGATLAVSLTADKIADGIRLAVDRFTSVDDAARSDLSALEAEL